MKDSPLFQLDPEDYTLMSDCVELIDPKTDNLIFAISVIGGFWKSHKQTEHDYPWVTISVVDPFLKIKNGPSFPHIVKNYLVVASEQIVEELRLIFNKLSDEKIPYLETLLKESSPNFETELCKMIEPVYKWLSKGVEEGNVLLLPSSSRIKKSKLAELKKDRSDKKLKS